MLDKAKSEINGKTDILFDYAVYEKDRQRVIAISVIIEPVDKQVADQKLNEITKLRSKRLRKKTTALEVAETGTLDDDPNILTLDYVSVPETTIPYSYGATPDLMAQELGVKAELDKLALVLAPEELDAVHVIIDAMVRMAGAPSDKMIDGGNAVFFQTVNNVIDNCKGLRRWFEGVASRYAAKVIPTARTKRAPMPYLYKSIMNDLEDYRLYVAGIGVEELRDEDAEPTENQAPPVPDLLEADFVEAEPDAAPAQLTSEDAATKKAMIAALEKFSDYENLKARLSGGQQEALEDIVQMTAYFCRRNVKGKDDGMIEGKANMQFVGSLNRVIARYGDLSPLFEALAVTMDYDTYWKELMKNPRIKNPKLVFQTEIEKALLMPAAVLGEFRARRGQDPLGAPVRDKEVDWLKAFEEV